LGPASTPIHTLAFRLAPFELVEIRPGCSTPQTADGVLRHGIPARF
jgi:hypothetical protein